MPSAKDAVGDEVTGHEPSEVELSKDPHLEFLDQIADQVDEERGLVQPAPEPEDKKAAAADEQIAAAGVDEPSYIDDPAKYRVRVKLEGKEEELTLDEVLRGFQKDQVASRRLNEATRLLQEAKEQKAQAEAQQKPLAQQTPPETLDVGPEAKKVIDALLEGDEDQAAAALAKLLEGRSTTPTQPAAAVNPEEIAASVKHQLKVESALKAFEDEFSDVVSDPHLATLTNGFLQEELQLEPDMAKALQNAGLRARAWVQKLTGGRTPSNDDSSTARDTRLDAKRGMDTVPNLSASSGSQGEVEETASDVIQAMKAERGLIA